MSIFNFGIACRIRGGVEMINRSVRTCILLTVMAAVVFLMQTIAGAMVYTVDEVTDRVNTVYVAGNPDFYPVEYYNEKTGQYEGVIPEMLEYISENTGIEFMYINDGSTRRELMNDPRTELISACSTDSNDLRLRNSFTAFSCYHDGKDMKIGWAYTDKIEKHIIDSIEKSAGKISEQQINGYFFTESERPDGGNVGLVLLNTVYLIVLAVIIAYSAILIRKARKEVNDNEMTDVQTGIGNGRYFERCFEKVITDVTRNLYYIAYIIIDSDYLETRYGEAGFKEAVKYTARVLKSYATTSSYAARITENGFVFAYQSDGTEPAVGIINGIMTKLNAYIKENDATAMHHYLYASLYRLKSTDINCEQILFNLRKNCSNIIGTGRQLVACDEEMMRSGAEEKILAESIIQGLNRNEFKLYLQFLVDNKTKKIVSAEALSRWDSPEHGIQPPDVYIGMMERLGQISRLDYYMFDMCCRQLHKWRDTEFGDLSISCNFARSTLSEADFVKNINQIAKKYVFDVKKLVIEITEDTMEKNYEQAISNIRRCKESGYRIALDDMGTGYTSLLNMCDYPIDIVKIDREILLKTDTENGKGLFLGVIALVHSLGCKVVCEGVETEEQQQLVGETECDFVQGWYYSRVFPAKEGEEFAKNYRKQHG